MNKKEVEYEQSLDYSVTYADEIILQVGKENARLIFYQDVIRLDENNSDIDKRKKYKKLKFEVRLPQSDLQKLDIVSLGIIKTR